MAATCHPERARENTDAAAWPLGRRRRKCFADSAAYGGTSRNTATHTGGAPVPRQTRPCSLARSHDDHAPTPARKVGWRESVRRDAVLGGGVKLFLPPAAEKDLGEGEPGGGFGAAGGGLVPEVDLHAVGQL